MKKKKISILALFTIILLLSSCDVTTLLDTFKGNAYEEVFNIDLVGEQAQEAVDAVVDALQPVVIGSDDPTLPVQTDEEKEELKSTIAKVLSGSSTDEFLEGLEEEADEDIAEAAENTADEIDGMLDDLLAPGNLDGLDQDIQDQISDLADDLRLDLPDNPTQADVLNVQLTSNLVNGLTDVLEQIDGGCRFRR